METINKILISEGTPYYACNLFRTAIPVFNKYFKIVLAAPNSRLIKTMAGENSVVYAPIPGMTLKSQESAAKVDVKIREIEKIIDFPVQKIFFASPEFHRFYLSNELGARSYFVQLYEYYERLIEDNHIKLFFTMGEDRLHNLIPYYILKQRGGVTYLGRMVPYFGITLTEDFFGPFTATGNVVATAEVDYDAHVGAILGTNSMRDVNAKRTVDLEMSREHGLPQKFMREADVLACELENSSLAHEDFRLLSRIARKIKRPLRELRRRHILKHVLYKDLSPNQEYVYYPLHVTEDAQLRLKYPEGYNQYELIRNICKNLPINLKLIVKEHPDAIGQYSVSELFSLSRLPNCVIVDPKVSSKLILKRAYSVVTVNSTVAYEALFYNKPVFRFGKTFHDDFPGIVPVKNVQELFGYLNDAEFVRMKRGEIGSGLREHVIRLLKASVRFDYQNLWAGPEMYEAVMRLIQTCQAQCAVPREK